MERKILSLVKVSTGREREREGIKFIFYGILEWVNECEVVLGRMIHAGNCDRRFFNNAHDDKS